MRRRAGPSLLAVWVAACAASSTSPESSSSRDPASPYDTTQEEFLVKARACVEARGYAMTLDLADARFSFSGGTDADARAANAALHDCVASIDPARLLPPPALTEEQLDAWYAYRIRQAECLGRAAYAQLDVPPRQVFVDTQGAWDPVEAILRSGKAVAPSDVIACQHLDGKPAFLAW